MSSRGSSRASGVVASELSSLSYTIGSTHRHSSVAKRARRAATETSTAATPYRFDGHDQGRGARQHSRATRQLHLQYQTTSVPSAQHPLRQGVVENERHSALAQAVPGQHGGCVLVSNSRRGVDLSTSPRCCEGFQPSRRPTQDHTHGRQHHRFQRKLLVPAQRALHHREVRTPSTRQTIGLATRTHPAQRSGWYTRTILVHAERRAAHVAWLGHHPLGRPRLHGPLEAQSARRAPFPACEQGHALQQREVLPRSATTRRRAPCTPLGTCRLHRRVAIGRFGTETRILH